MEIGVHEAKTKLSKLIPAVLAGEEVIITKSGKPLVKLVPVQGQGGERPLGCYSGRVKLADDLLAPLPQEMVDDFWAGEGGDAVPS